MAGIAPDKFLKTDDELELRFLALVADAAIDQYQINQKNQAALIISYLGKALGSDKK